MTADHPPVPRHPRADRQKVLVAFLRLALAVVGALAAAAVAAPEPWADRFGVAVVAVLVAVPVVRVAWLGTRWLRRGDPRFAAAALALLAVMAGGVALAG